MRSAEVPPGELWGASGPFFPLMGGHRNAVFRASGPDGDLVFKSTQRSEAAIAWLEPIHKAARRAGFIVPVTLKSKSGRFSEEGWVCETFIRGVPLDKDEIDAVAGELSRFHELTDCFSQRPGFLASWELLEKSKGGDIDLDAMPIELSRECRQAWAAVSEERRGVVHGDLNGQNILRSGSGRYTLLDWDECRVDLRLFDEVQTREASRTERRAALAWEVACSWQREPKYARERARELLSN